MNLIWWAEEDCSSADWNIEDWPELFITPYRIGVFRLAGQLANNLMTMGALSDTFRHCFSVLLVLGFTTFLSSLILNQILALILRPAVWRVKSVLMPWPTEQPQWNRVHWSPSDVFPTGQGRVSLIMLRSSVFKWSLDSVVRTHQLTDGSFDSLTN